MNKNIRSVLYAAGLQFCFPGLGRLYLKDWATGVLQFLTSTIGIGIIWSWVDGYSLINHQQERKNEKIDLVYHQSRSKKTDFLIQENSPLIASVLQLFLPGLGRIYSNFKVIGFTQLGLLLLSYYSIFNLILNQYVFSKNTFKIHIFYSLVLTFLVIIVLRFILWRAYIFDNYTLLKRYEQNGNKRRLRFFMEEIPAGLTYHLLFSIGYRQPLNFLKLKRVMKVKIGSRDRLVAGILQLFLPGSGKFYLGYRGIGILQFLSSFILIGIIWSWIDGHHILLNPDIGKDGKGNLLTDQYRL